VDLALVPLLEVLAPTQLTATRDCTVTTLIPALLKSLLELLAPLLIHANLVPNVMLQSVLDLPPRPTELLVSPPTNVLSVTSATFQPVFLLHQPSHALTILTALETTDTLEPAHAFLEPHTLVKLPPHKTFYHHVLLKEALFKAVLNPRDAIQDLLELTAATMNSIVSVLVLPNLLLEELAAYVETLFPAPTQPPPRVLLSLLKLASCWPWLLSWHSSSK